MTRPLRIEYDGAWYHVMNRGLTHNLIFLRDSHRQIFLDLLFEVHNRYQAEIHAYCLMSNHYHLLIRTCLGNISRVMRHLDGVYTQRFNADVKRDGPLFRGRFKAILVEADVYLLRLSRYIHLNPVKARLVSKPEHFKWSSYQSYLSGESPYWLNTKYTLSYFDGELQQHKYKAFVEEGIDKEINDFYTKLKNIPILGTKAFAETIAEKYLKEEHKITDIPAHKYFIFNSRVTAKIQNIISSVASYYHVHQDDIHKIGKGIGNRPRAISIYLAFTVGQYTLSQISQLFSGLTTSGVSKVCSRLQDKMRNDENLRKEIEDVRRFVVGMSNVKI